MVGSLLIAGLQCNVDNLPPFRDFREDDPKSEVPEHDRFQAIVPDYTFLCSGRVTGWGACVQPGGSGDERYYIQFQVWRPTGISGCYSLVNFSRPVNEDGDDGFLSPPDNEDGDYLRRCVVLSVPEDQQIEVQSRDVVGYYVEGLNRNGGIQWIVRNTQNEKSRRNSNGNVVVHYRDNLPREDIKSHYALDGVNPTSCGFPTSGGSINSYSLTTSTQAAPIISLNGMCMNTAILSLYHCKYSTVTAVPMPTTSVTSSVIIGE